MERLMALLPTARICLERSEADAYMAAGVPKKKLWLHPPLGGMAEKRQWMLDHCKAGILIMCDDDLKCVKCMVGRYIRMTTDAGAILQIIENGMHKAVDLGLSLFSWSRAPNPMQFQGHNFYSWTGPAAGCFGSGFDAIRNAKRRRAT